MPTAPVGDMVAMSAFSRRSDSSFALVNLGSLFRPEIVLILFALAATAVRGRVLASRRGRLARAAVSRATR